MRKASAALRVAIERGDLDFCKGIVQGGADLEGGYQGCHGCSHLQYSLHCRQAAIAEYPAPNGASPAGVVCSPINPSGYSAFHYAAELNYVKLLHILLDHHTDQYHNLVYPVHPFHLATVGKALGSVNPLLEEAKIRKFLPKGRIFKEAHQYGGRIFTAQHHKIQT